MSRKIIGVTVGTSLPKPNFDQTDPRKGDFIKGDRSFLNMDDTLSIAGRPADAKATGDAINQVQANIDEIAGLIGDAADGHTHDDRYYTEEEINGMLDTMQIDIDSKVDAIDGMGLSTNDYTTAEKDKLATVEDNANFYEHPAHTSHNLGLYKVTVDDFGHVSDATPVEKEDIVELGIPAQDTVYDDSDLRNIIDDVENGINTINEALNDISEDYENYKTTNNERVSTNIDNIEINRADIEVIKGDYLKSTDKTQLQNDIIEVSDKVTANTSAITTLNGEGEGSVKQFIDDAFNEFAANLSDDGVVNTYKELIDYAAEHGPEFTELVGQVDTINVDVGELKTDFSNYQTEVSERFTEVDTAINNHIVDTNNPHGVTKDQIGLANVDDTPDLDKPISNATQEALDNKADLGHIHEIEEINSLQDLLDGLQADIDTHEETLNEKADLAHVHEIEEINSLQDSLDKLRDDIDTHIENKDNPHEVTTEQIGAYTKEEVDDKIESLDMLTYITSTGVLCITVADLTRMTSSISSGNVTSNELTSTYSNENVTISGFNSYIYANENIIII